MRDPGDVGELAALCELGNKLACKVVAIFGKTEGNGCVNDFTRPYSVDALLHYSLINCCLNRDPRRSPW